MAAGTLRPYAFAVIKDGAVQNIVSIANTNWKQPENTTLVQLFENENCNIGDTYFPLGVPPTGRFIFAVIDINDEFEETITKPPLRLQSGGSDSGTLYVPGSVVLGNDDSIPDAVYYLQFQDGTTQTTAVTSHVKSLNGSTGTIVLGSTTQLIYNTGGALTGSPNMVYTGLTLGLTADMKIVGNLIVTGKIITSTGIEGDPDADIETIENMLLDGGEYP